MYRVWIQWHHRLYSPFPYNAGINAGTRCVHAVINYRNIFACVEAIYCRRPFSFERSLIDCGSAYKLSLHSAAGRGLLIINAKWDDVRERYGSPHSGLVGLWSDVSVLNRGSMTSACHKSALSCFGSLFSSGTCLAVSFSVCCFVSASFNSCCLFSTVSLSLFFSHPVFLGFFLFFLRCPVRQPPVRQTVASSQAHSGVCVSAALFDWPLNLRWAFTHFVSVYRIFATTQPLSGSHVLKEVWECIKLLCFYILNKLQLFLINSKGLKKCNVQVK